MRILLLTLLLAQPLPHSADLYVSGFLDSSVQRFLGPRSAAPAAPGGTYARPVSRRPWGIAFGPDGNLYAAGAGPVRRYDVLTHALIDEFTHGYDLAQTRGIAFGPDGNLYVSNYTGAKGEVVRFDGATGDFRGVYVAGGRGGLRAPWKIAFNGRGDLLIANWESGSGNVLRFDGRTGAFIDVFIPSVAGGPRGLAFSPGAR